MIISRTLRGVVVAMVAFLVLSGNAQPAAALPAWT